MKLPLRLKSVRARLTFWYIATLAAVLAAYSVAVYGFFRSDLISDLDLKLREDLEAAEERLPEFTTNPKAFDHIDERETWTLEVWDPARGNLYSAAPSSAQALGPPNEQCSHRQIVNRTQRLGDGLYLRVGCKAVTADGKTYVIRAARSADRIYDEIHQLLFMMLLTVPAGIFGCALAGYLLARRALKPVSEMTRKASQISAEKLAQRLPIENPEDELGELARTFNGTFERLEKSFDQMRRFTSDASHELRTPLTAMRTVGEVSLRKSRTTDEYRETISSMLEETDHLRNLVDSLLTLSRADANQLRLEKQNADLSELSRQVVEQVGVLAEEREQTIELVSPGPVSIHADRSVLRQAIVNLVDNAIKYAGKGANIRIVVLQDMKTASLRVEDNGPGIPVDYHTQIFERFYRVDSSRARDQGSTGLGLAIAKWAVEAHGGNIAVRSGEGRGTCFTISLPI